MERAIITILGCVQGVGFRPFVFRLAHQYDLKGCISNTTSGVVIDIQGTKNALALFQHDLVVAKPKGAIIAKIHTVGAPVLNEIDGFIIKQSQQNADTALALLPDTAMCEQCIKELFDPHNRRFQYPFLHCITCGPRFSLFLAMPFDRVNTTMANFQMCQECHREYVDPENRRFYSQTNCCPQCGPELQLLNNKGNVLANTQEAMELAIALIQEGKIVCAKSTGGYQLLVDGTNHDAVKRLRRLKHRAGKPFALLMPSLARIHQVASVCQVAEQVVTSPAAPIVLLRKKDGQCQIAPSVAGESPYYGVMLPHSGIQHLMLNILDRPLVATSGNISGSPLCITEEEALFQLSHVADAFLIHNRQIKHRLDDSIVHVVANQPVMMRRARGYIPYAVDIPRCFSGEGSTALLATGSQQKSSFAFAKKTHIYLSQHIGELENAKTCQAYDREVDQWEKLLAINPAEGVADKHPDFYGSHYLHHRRLPITKIQHHQAHVWAGMVDCHLNYPFFSASWDGTGYGDDGMIWGGESFIVTEDAVHRMATLSPFRLPGGEKAVREPRRSALGVLYAISEGEFPHNWKQWLHEVFDRQELGLLLNALRQNAHAPMCSSIGRLFDAVSALLGYCKISDFEGEAAILLEAAAMEAQDKEFGHYQIELLEEKGIWYMDWHSMLTAIMEERDTMVFSEIAWAFHDALAQSVVDLAKIAQQGNVLLTGGVMQNKLLAEMAVVKLQNEGFTPYLHREIPPNDGGIALGQIIGKMREGKDVSGAPR